MTVRIFTLSTSRQNKETLEYLFSLRVEKEMTVRIFTLFTSRQSKVTLEYLLSLRIDKAIRR